MIVPPQLVCRILCSMSRVWYGDQKKSTARRLSMPCSGVARAWRVARGAWRMARGKWQVARGTRHAAWQVGARGCGGEARLAVGEVHEKLEDVGHRHRDDHVEDHVPRAQRAHHAHLARCGVHAWPVCVRVRLFGAPQSENVTTNSEAYALAMGMGCSQSTDRCWGKAAVSALPPAASYFVRLPRE